MHYFVLPGYAVVAGGVDARRCLVLPSLADVASKVHTLIRFVLPGCTVVARRGPGLCLVLPGMAT